MNNIYQLKYDRRRQQWVVVSELVMGAGKGGAATRRRTLLTLTPLALVITLLLGGWPGPGAANPVLPTGGQIVAGQGTIQRSGSQLTVNQRTPGMVATWHSFDIGASQTVQFVQPNSQAIALNRVTGGRESQILGALTANGQVMLVNPAGVMLGHGAKVNTAGMVASTKHISTADFMAGRYTFSGGSQPGAQIVNQGSLAATPGGYIVLVGDRVRNEGRMSAPGGKVLLAAADKVTLQLDNAGLAAVSVDGRVVNALVENRGLISADNGQVYLTARGQAMLLDTVVNNSGTVEAKGLSARGGELVLDGGDSGVVRQSGELLADSDTGRGGTITLEGQHIQLAHGSRTSATGRTGGGEVYVGGGWQGKDSRIRQASKVVMDNDALIDVSATARGQGGTAVLWSNDYTHFRGTILARGGQQGGDGGRVETSSHHNLQAFGDVDASAVKGNGGEWLLDPFDISIVGSGSATNVTEGTASNGIFTPMASGSQVLNTTINDRLNKGTQVTIKTQTASAGTDSASGQWGNITVNADIQKSSGTSNVSLTLAADGNINITDHRITSTAGKLAINLLAAGSHSGSITLNNATLSTNGGNLTLGPLNASASSMADAAPTLGSLNARANSTAALTVNITNSTLNASGGVLRAHAVNPNINLAESALSAVYNGSNNLVAVSNSTLTAATLILTGTQNGENGRYLPVYLTNATLKAAQDLLIVGDSSDLGNASRLELRGCNTLSAGGNLAIGNTRSGIFLNGTAQANSNLTANHSLTLIGLSAMDNPGVKVFDGRLQANDITLDGSSMKPTSKGLELNHSTLLAAGNIHVSGNMTVSNASSSEGFGAHIYNDSTLTAAENITITGYALNGTNGGLNVHGGTFSAKNTLLSGTSQQNNIGIKIGGNVNVTAGNLSITGSANRINTASGVTGVTSDGNLTLNVSAGKLNISATVNDTGNQADNAATSAGLNLSNTTLTANSAEIHGVNTYGNGTGFALNNVSLAGALADGANLTLSSQGSAQRVTNSVNLNGGLSYSAFQRLQQAGIDNDTVLMVTPDTADLAAMGLNATTGWSFDASHAGAPVANKAGTWGLIFNAINVTTSGDIDLTGVSMTNSNLTGRHVSLQGATNGPLMVTGSALHATDGDVTLNTTGGSLTVNNSNLSTTKGDITLNASKGVLAANNSNLHASGGDITIAGARVQKPGPDGVGITGGTLNATGNISITGYGTGGFSNGGLRLTNVVLNASAITLNGSKNTAPGNTGSTPGLDLNNVTLTAVNDITLIGPANQNGMRIRNSSVLNSTQGHVSITGLSTGLGGYDKVSIDINNSTISAYSGITLSGNSTNNPGAGVVLDKANMTASAGNISVTGKGGGSANGSLYVKNSNFSAQNTVLEGTTSSGNNSVQLGGNITVTQGNLSVTGDGGNGGSVGIQGQSGLNVTVANGSLSMNGSTSGNSAGLNLTNASLSANNASLTGSNTGSGFGFVLNNVTLNGGIANGTNTTFSSAGSAGVVTNVIGQGVLNATTTEALMRAGIENNTQINASDVADLAESSSDDWTGDYTSSKGGGWIFDSANITKTGNINLTGVGFVNSNLTAGNISLSAATGSLLVTDSTLNATVGNVSLSTANGTLTVGNANLSSAGGETTLCATTSSGNGGAGVKLAGTVNATQGNLTVNGTNLAGEGNVWGVDARNVTLNLSAENAVLTIMGNVANGVGLDLSGESVLNASRANLSGISVQSGYGFRLSPELQGGLTTNGSLTLSSQGSGANVSNWIGVRVNATIVKHMIDTNVSIGSYTETGMENLYTQDDFTRWLSDGDLRKDFGDFGLKFSNITITAGDIDLTGVSFTNSNLTASRGNLTINSNGSLGLANTSLNASAGNVSLTGRAGISLTGNSSIAAKDNITLHAPVGGMNINGEANASMGIRSSNGSITFTAHNPSVGEVTGINLGNANVQANNGSIDLNGSAINGSLQSSAVKLNTVKLTAKNNISLNASGAGSAIVGSNIVLNSKDSINVNATGKSSGYSFAVAGFSYSSFTAKNNISFASSGTEEEGTHMQSALGFYGNTLFDAKNTALTGKHRNPGLSTQYATIGVTITNSSPGYTDGVGNLTVNGNLSINGDTKDGGPGVVIGANVNVIGQVDIKGTSPSGEGVSFTTSADDGNPSRVVNLNINISEGGNISGTSDTGTGLMNGNKKNVVNIVTGNQTTLSLTGKSLSGDGIIVRGIVTGNTQGSHDGEVIFTGHSDDGRGVNLSDANMTGVRVSGNANRGVGVSLSGSVTDGSLAGNSVSSSGVHVAGDSTLTDVALSGGSIDGSGVAVNANLTNLGDSRVSGRAIGRGNGVELAGQVSGGNVSGAATVGSGVRVSGDSTLTDVALRGGSIDGSGVTVNANLTNLGDSRVSGSATGNGNGVELAGQVSGGNVSGAATVGSGVRVSGDSTLTDVALRGDSVDGSGVAVNANLTNLGDSRVSGRAIGRGNGVELAGQVSGSNVSGAATVGSGVRVSGDSTLTDVALRGDSVDGSGVAVNANLTNLGDSRVSGSATGNGTGVELAGQVSGGNVSGAATVGSGVRVSGDSTLTDVALRGDSVDGSGVAVNANLTNLGDSRVSGSATGNGTGVELAGQVTGGALQGQANRGTGLRITGNSSLYGVAVTASSQSGRSTLINALLTTLGGTSLNGQEQQDSSAMRHQVFTRQKQLSHAEEEATARQASGYQAAENPVSLDICTGDGPCQHVTLGGPTRP
ncbi:hypothetical protein A9798_09020 [Edwardsiella hoshinae]|uniref:Filamentous haemagglutinin FhaB/tRNA nuclease CdiA-like TPS domain-containing protein n=1 Tax=Edwardsiella hoshinae TaxID=93378 RepID=A0ABN4T1D2_9GAMM|nr:filamentous hemagglutinin N-terminal domain-containing protein [Edwardsiella hoshinae]AOV97091.1 hypothetical protein A9798_09020 [Edwardsiella hoshinae]